MQWAWIRYDGSESEYRETCSPLVSNNESGGLVDSADILAQAISDLLCDRSVECEFCTVYRGKATACEDSWGIYSNLS
jgi:hypothetical protein